MLHPDPPSVAAELGALGVAVRDASHVPRELFVLLVIRLPLGAAEARGRCRPRGEGVTTRQY